MCWKLRKINVKCNNGYTVQNEEGIVQMREKSESGIRKWEEMWFKTTAEDGERERGAAVRAMEVSSTDERLQQETLCHRQWTEEYVELTSMRQNV